MREEIYAFPRMEGLPLQIVMAGITYPDPSYRMERQKERNRLYVFEYVMEGCGHLQIDGKKFDVCAGNTYILTPHTKECYFADKDEPFKKIWVNIESSYLDAVLQTHGLSYGVFRYNSLPMLKEILERAKRGGSTATASAEVAPILLLLIESLSGKYEQKESTDTAHRIKEYIDALGNEPFSPAALAQELHVSLSTLTRIFEKAYEYTPYEYYLSCKEKMAKTLLQNTALSTKEIAFRLGFSDEHYFSNFFKKRTGMRPVEYKKGCRFDP
jgi:AraC-like DNA-binding protein